MRRNKYNVAPKEQRTARDGTVFDSKAELNRYEDLKLWQLSGDIRNLKRQVEYKLVVNGVLIGKYTADFDYEKKHGVRGLEYVTHDNWIEVTEDVKGAMTRAAALRIKLFEALYGRKVNIVRGK